MKHADKGTNLISRNYAAKQNEQQFKQLKGRQSASVVIVKL